MSFEWDEQKKEINVRKHGSSFVDAYLVFQSPMAIDLDSRSNYIEDRWIGTGMLNGRVVVIVYTEVNEETIRVIFLRKALSPERKQYEQYLRNRLG